MKLFRKTILALIPVIGLLAPGSRARADQYEPSASYERENYHGSDWFYLDADGGLQAVNLQTFKANRERLTAGVVPSSGLGPSASFGLGFRLLFVTLGVRARVGAFNDSSFERTVGDWQMWSLDGELGLRIPLLKWEPYIRFDGGYTTLGSLGDAINGLGAGIDIDGANVGATIGVDYFATKALTLGVAVGGDLLFLSRKGVAVRELLAPQQVSTLNEAEARILEGNGSSIGTSLTVYGSAGLHF